MIRNIIATTILLASPLAYANGFYLGAGAGPASTTFNQHSHVVVQPPGSGITANVFDNNELSGTGAVGSLIGGYQWQRMHYSLAGEVNLSMTSIKHSFSNIEKLSNTATSTSYRMQHSVGISVLPGYIYRDTTVYVRLGVVSGNLKISTSDVSLATTNRNMNGFRCGIGVSQDITPTFSARMEYSNISYQSTKLHVVTGPATKDTTFKPDTGEVEFSLLYHFV